MLLEHQRPGTNLVKVTYKDHSAKRDKEIPSRKDAALIAQPRSGHCLKLAAYRFCRKTHQTSAPIARRQQKTFNTGCAGLPCHSGDPHENFREVGSPLGALTNNISRVLEGLADSRSL